MSNYLTMELVGSVILTHNTLRKVHCDPICHDQLPSAPGELHLMRLMKCLINPQHESVVPNASKTFGRKSKKTISRKGGVASVPVIARQISMASKTNTSIKI